MSDEPSWVERVAESASWVAGFVAPGFIALVILVGDLAGVSRIVGCGGYVVRGVGAGLLITLVVYGVVALLVRLKKKPELEALPMLVAIGMACFAGGGLGFVPPIYNVLLDSSRPVVRRVEVVRTEERTSKKRKYRVAILRSWIDPTEEFEVDIKRAWQVEPKSSLRLSTRAGALGWAWVEDVLPPDPQR